MALSSRLMKGRISGGAVSDGAQSIGTAKDYLVSVEEEIKSSKDVENKGDKGESSDK